MKEFKPAVYFVLRFLGFYLIVNVGYGLFINAYHPNPDPITHSVTIQSAYLLSLAYPEVMVRTNSDQPSIAIYNLDDRVINVFEGCNGINVMIVFVAFLIAFKGSVKRTLIFGLAGIVIIYLANLIRVILLYETALRWENHFYYLHKYVFTGALYALVMVLWVLWIKKVQASNDRE